MKRHVLIIYEEQQVCDDLSAILRNDVCCVSSFTNTTDGLQHLFVNPCNLMIVSSVLGKDDKYSLIAAFEKLKEPPMLLFFTFETETVINDLLVGDNLEFYQQVSSKLKGYLVKRSSLHRIDIKNLTVVKSECGYLQIDRAYRTAIFNDRELSLTQYEFDILYLLASHPAVVFSYTQLYENTTAELWIAPNAAIQNRISRLRKKLGNAAIIQSVHDLGYRFV